MGKHVYDNGSLFEPDVLALADDMILGSFHAGVRNVAALSIQLGMPSVVSVPYTVLPPSRTCSQSLSPLTSISRAARRSRPTSRILLPSHSLLALLHLVVALLLLLLLQPLSWRKRKRKKWLLLLT